MLTYNERNDLLLKILVVISLFNMLVKNMNMLKVSKKFGIMTMMIAKAFIEAIPVLSIFILMIIFFALQFFVLGSNLEEAKVYEGVPLGVAYFLLTFENSVGNILRPSFEISTVNKSNNKLKSVLIYTIYLIWFLM